MPQVEFNGRHCQPNYQIAPFSPRFAEEWRHGVSSERLSRLQQHRTQLHSRLSSEGFDYQTNGVREKQGSSSREDANSGSDPGNCRAIGLVSSYEKVVDFTYDIGRKTQITTELDIGIVTQCLDSCTNQGADCLSMTLLNERGGRQRCFSHAGSATVDNNDPTAATGVFYFEKICIQDRSCRKAWSFTRVPRFEFIGDANEEVNDVKSIEHCRNLCLAASFYTCRSATYDSNARICRLSEETKSSAPSDFRPADRGIDYLENECANGKLYFHNDVNTSFTLVSFIQFQPTASTWTSRGRICLSPTLTSRELTTSRNVDRNALPKAVTTAVRSTSTPSAKSVSWVLTIPSVCHLGCNRTEISLSVNAEDAILVLKMMEESRVRGKSKGKKNFTFSCLSFLFHHFLFPFYFC